MSSVSHRHGSAKTLAGLALLACISFGSNAETSWPAVLADTAKKAYAEKYQPAVRHKAFAITRDGQHFYYVYGLQTPGRAARTASLRCLTAHGVPCVVWKVNDDDVLALYDKAAEDSARAIASLPADFPAKVYAGEDTEMGVSAPPALRDSTQVHSATPLAGPPGTNVISTQDLVKLYKSQPGLVVLDVLAVDAVKKETLPGAAWLDGAGAAESDKNKGIASNLSRVMAVIAPDKNTPIVCYCLNWECWLSWNAAMRLVTLGYAQIYWYRGGIEAWKAARLPVVETPITAELW